MYKKNSIPMSSVSFAYLKGGSLTETNETAGTSHLMEHLICHSFDKIRDDLQKNGITVNAGTSEEYIVCHISGIDHRVGRMVDQWADTILNPNPVSQEVFENEKKTVLKELAMYVADPVSRVLRINSVRRHYGIDSPLGTVESINSFGYEQYLEKLEMFRSPDEGLIIGPTYYSDKLDINNIDAIQSFDRKNITVVNDSGMPMVTGQDTPQKVLLWTNKNMISDNRRSAAAKILINMLSSGLNSPMYQEIREKRGLCYVLQGVQRSYYQRNAAFIILSDAPDEAKKVMEEILSNIPKYITKERFDIVKEMSIVEEEKHNIYLYENLFDELRRDLGFVYDAETEGITFEEILEVAKSFDLSEFFFYQE